jgi:drug/metabolite transporter (DMT)-like permease
VTDTSIAAAPTTSSKNVHWTGWAIALGSTIAFSFATPLARAAILLGIAPSALLAIRLTLTTLLLFGTILFGGTARLRIDRRGLGMCILAGVANGVGMLAYFSSLTRISSSIASMIFSLSPLVVLALLALRGEKFTARNTARLALGLGGVYLLIGPGGNVDFTGALLALASVFTVPFQIVIMQWFLGDYDARTVTLYMVGTMMVITVGAWLVEGAEWRDPGWQGWVLVMALAVVSTYLARLMLFVSVRKIGGGQTGLLAPLETLFTVIWSILFLRERLMPVQWIGSSLIVLSAALAVKRLWQARRRK